MESFDEFFARREKAAARYVAGDGAGVDAIVPHEGAATFHHPNGATVTGAAEVAARYLSDARSFEEGGTSRLEVLQRGVDGELAFWTGFQIASVRMKGKDAPIEMRIRITEVFRRIDGAWRLVHRLADGAAPPK